MYPEHSGMYYTKFLAEISKKLGVTNYLEIGIRSGYNLTQMQCKNAVAIDPAFDLTHNIIKMKTRVMLFQCTSDEFFEEDFLADTSIYPFDLAFLDGMHLIEYLLRDFSNTEKRCKNGSLILMHDCLPSNYEMTERDFDKSKRTEEKFANWWTGDVWKIIPILKEFRPDLNLTAINCAPTGLLAISNLNPLSTALESSHAEIVSRFQPTKRDDEETLLTMYRQLQIVDADDLLSHDDMKALYS